MKSYFIHKYIDRDYTTEKLVGGNIVVLPKVIVDEPTLKDILNKLPDFNDVYYKADFNIGDLVKLCTHPDHFTYDYNYGGMTNAIGSVQFIEAIGSDGRVFFHNPGNCRLLNFSYSVDDIVEVIKKSLEKYKFDKKKEQWILS